jgi:hypothetical protein
MSKNPLRSNEQTCYIFFYEKNDDQEDCVVNIYRAVDGNPERTGLDLAYAILQYRIVDSLPPPQGQDYAIRYAHGAGDLWAALIAMLKDSHTADHVYILSPRNVKPKEKDYLYDIVVDHSTVTMRIRKGNSIIFSGHPSKFIQ